jgi:hypothetical protein
VDKLCRSEEATNYNMAGYHFTLGTTGYKHIYGTCNTLLIHCNNGRTNLLNVTLYIQYLLFRTAISGPGSSVGIATGYGLDGPGIKCR